MKSVMSKMKWFVIVSLVILVAGMTMFGILGFNNTVDNKESYEVKVSVTQGTDDVKKILVDKTNDFMTSTNLKDKHYAYQVEDEGKTLIFKFDTDVQDKIAGLEDAVNAGLEGIEGATCKVTHSSKVNKSVDLQSGWVLLAVGITIVAIFIYMLIMEKLASAVATLCSAVASFLIFVSLMAITRMPAVDFVGAFSALSMTLATVLSMSTVHSYKIRIKNTTNTKFNAKEIADYVGNNEKKKYLFALIITLFASLAVIALFTPYLMVIGGQIALAGISAVYTAYFITPLVWSGIKKSAK